MSVWFYARYEIQQKPVRTIPVKAATNSSTVVHTMLAKNLKANSELYVSDEALEELSEELDNECPNWSGTSNLSPDEVWDYKPSEFLSKHLSFYKDSISNIRALLAVNVGQAEERHFRGMLYVSVITALETYLLDNFSFRVNDDDEVFRRFIETTHAFSVEKFSINEIFEKMESLRARANSHIKAVVWHRLSEASRLYHNTLEIDFPQDMRKLLASVLARHDFVHRNGRTADGEERNPTVDEINELITEVEKLVRSIEDQCELAQTLEIIPEGVPYQPPSGTIDEI